MPRLVVDVDAGYRIRRAMGRTVDVRSDRPNLSHGVVNADTSPYAMRRVMRQTYLLLVLRTSR
jgi:hypothetical protein